MLKMINDKKIVILLLMFLLISCNGRNSFMSNLMNDSIDSLMIGKYKTEYIVHYGIECSQPNIIYSDNEVYTCSFQGTNFLLEKDNPEEILSTTAPIQIISCEKIEQAN